MHSYTLSKLHKASLARFTVAMVIASVSASVWASGEVALKASCTLIVDVDTGKKVHSSGDCGKRYSPASTYKIALAVMGFDAGILVDAQNPVWELPPTAPSQNSAIQMGTPTTWQSQSILWYSRELTKTLGRVRMEQYVYKFSYGNKDATSGVVGRPGTHSSWVGGSLLISAQEQVEFLRKLVLEELPVSVRSQQAAKTIIPQARTASGWRVHGKIGSTWTYSRAWVANLSEPIGWYVGWVSREDKTYVFARVTVGDKPFQTPLGLLVKEQFLGEVDALMAAQ
jgi:beta-lactamase class D